MKIRKRATALFMVLNLVLGLLLPAANVFAVGNNKSSSENEACVYGVTTTLSDDKQTANVQVTIQPKDNITVHSLILPNGEEREFTSNVIEFQMTENGTFSLVVNYQSAESTELKKAEIPIEITGIEKSSETSDTDIQNNDVDTNQAQTRATQITKNFTVTPTNVTTSSARISMLHDVLYDANTPDAEYTYKIPTALVSEKDLNPIEIASSPVVDENSVTISLQGNKFDPEVDTNWDGTSYYVVKFRLKAGVASAGELRLQSTIKTPAYKAKTQFASTIEVYEDGTLIKTQPISINISGTKPTVLNAQVANPKFTTATGQYAEALEASKLAENADYNLNRKMAIGEISFSSPESNRIIYSLNSQSMDSNGAKGVRFTATLPSTVSIYKNNTPEYTDTPSGIMLVEQKIDITDPKNPAIGQPYSVSAKYKEVGGSFGDPLNSGEIRLTKNSNGETQLEVAALDLDPDVKLFVEYYQKVESIPTNTDKYPAYVNKGEVTWNGSNQPAKSMTWQSFRDDKNSVFLATHEVNKTTVFQGDELTYTIRITTKNAGFNYIVQNNMLSNLPIIKDSITVNDNSINAKIKDGKLIINGSQAVANKEYEISFKVKTDDLSSLTTIDNTFFLVGSDDVLLRGNTVSTNIMGRVIEKYVDEDGNSLSTDIVTDGQLGANITPNIKTFADYDLVNTKYDSNNFDQTFKPNIQTITYVYKKKVIDKIDKSVTKVWDDNNNQDGIRPEEVKVQLYADGKAVGTAVTLNAANQWKHTFSNLAKKANGKEIAYTVKEVAVPTGYTDKVEIGNDGNFTVTNTHTVKTPPSNESTTPSQSTPTPSQSNKKSDKEQEKNIIAVLLPLTGSHSGLGLTILGLVLLIALLAGLAYHKVKKAKVKKA